MRPFDVTLRTKNQNTSLNLVLAEDESGNKAWTEGRLRPFLAGLRTSADSPNHDPTETLDFSQHEWTDGGLRSRYNKNLPNTYAESSFDMRWGTSALRGIPRNFGQFRGNPGAPIGVQMADPNFEATALGLSNQPGRWDTLGTPTSIDLNSTVDPRTVLFGSQHALIDTAANGDGIKTTVRVASVWQGKSITLSAYIKKVSGTGSGRVAIEDSAGTTSGNFESSPTSYGLSTVTRTIDAAATFVTFKILGTGDMTFEVDDVSIYSGTTLTPGRIIRFKNEIYTTFGRMVCKLFTTDEDEFMWDPVYIHASAEATDIIANAGTLYVAFGGSTAYFYSTDGATFTAAAAGAGAANNAVKWAVSRDEIWKAESNSVVSRSIEAVEDGDGWLAFTVGDDQQAVNNLFSYADTVWVGKQDGLYVFLRTYDDGTIANTFINQTREYEVHPDSDVFSRGIVHKGALFIKPGDSGLWMIDPRSMRPVDLTRLFVNPDTNAKGVIRALTHDPTGVWIAVDDKMVQLLEDEDGNLVVHTIRPPSITTSDSTSLLTTVDTGFILSGTGTNVNQGEDVPWDNAGFISADDGTTAQVILGPGQDSWIIASGEFGFSLPPGAVITGMEAQIEGASATADTGVRCDRVTLRGVAGELATGFGSAANKGGVWPSTPGTVTVGGVGDSWGFPLTAEDVDDDPFGVAFTVINPSSDIATVQVDSVYFKLYYVIATSSEGVVPLQAAVVSWPIGGIAYPHLLASTYGIESTDNVPYAVTDVWALPRGGASPDLSLDKHASTEDYLRTVRWDGGFPDTDKVLDWITVLTANGTGGETVTVGIAHDTDTSSFLTLGSFNAGVSQTNTVFSVDLADPDSQAVGKVWQLIFFVTDAPEDFRIIGFTAHFHVAPRRRREWTLTMLLGDNISTNEGLPDVETAKQKLDKLALLETNGYPIEMVEDINNEGVDTVTLVQVVPDSIGVAAEKDYKTGPGQRVYQVKLREMRVS